MIGTFLKVARAGLIALALTSCAVATCAVAETVTVVGPTLPIVTVQPTWWQGLLASATPLLVAAAVAVLGWIGTIIKAKLDQYVPHMVGQIVSNQYDKMTDAAAGYLENELKKLAGGAPSAFQTAAGMATAPRPAVDENHPAVKAAVQYAKDSFPEAIANANVSNPFELAQDIIASFGKKAKVKPA